MLDTFFSSASGQSKFVLEIIVFCNMQNEKVFLRIQSGPKKCIHSLLINIFGINLNEIYISG